MSHPLPILFQHPQQRFRMIGFKDVVVGTAEIEMEISTAFAVLEVDLEREAVVEGNRFCFQFFTAHGVGQSA